ncbi:SDR family NAD(P)-dependent oxidoreductase [Mycolicibacterium baixiangningiae]|uniref:SDR family NAD(P)-dependent oxidoreductase n=1 Tax=Mycolicibacterium baixiangningiae TaxID=2761578 RepID=UPI00355741F3
MKRFSGGHSVLGRKTVLITGCSSGYGLATAQRFHSDGWNVIATMRTPRDEVLAPGERLTVLPLDVTDPASISEAVASCDLILVRLVEVLLVEAMRLRAAPVEGVERGLDDPLLAPALRTMHADIAFGWTVERLARAAGVSRAVFAERFSRTMGMLPMQYLTQWRMALAKDMLRIEDVSMAEVARRTGYLSASAFTTAFTRMTGSSPSAFARASG